MRMSCNGCRVLRKGCAEKCSIKPCLEWIKSPDSQSHATLFLAKFYGRAGLINLINAAPNHLRPATFRSLLYESCGRMVNPIYGSVGLLWSGQWHLCQEAVESVLKGAPITPISTEDASNVPPIIKGPYDIRHVTKHEKSNSNRACFKRARGIVKPKATKLSRPSTTKAVALAMANNDLNESSTSHDSSVSHPNEATVDTNSNSCTVSIDTLKGDVSQGEDIGNGLELELTLGFGL